MKNKVFITLCVYILSFVFGSDEEVYSEENLIAFAHKPLRAVDQISLNNADEVLTSRETVSSMDVYEILLAGTNFTTDIEGKTKLLYQYLRQQPLPRLRKLDLRGCIGVDAFLAEVLREGISKTFYSLMCIDLSQSDVTHGGIQLLMDHLKKYDKVVRDMPTYSERSSSNMIQTRIIVGPLLVQLAEALIERRIFAYYRAGGVEHGAVLYRVNIDIDFDQLRAELNRLNKERYGDTAVALARAMQINPSTLGSFLCGRSHTSPTALEGYRRNFASLYPAAKDEEIKGEERPAEGEDKLSAAAGAKAGDDESSPKVPNLPSIAISEIHAAFPELASFQEQRLSELFAFFKALDLKMQSGL